MRSNGSNSSTNVAPNLIRQRPLPTQATSAHVKFHEAPKANGSPPPGFGSVRQRKRTLQAVKAAAAETLTSSEKREQSEYRIDRSDGGLYSRAEFVEFYGGLVEWENALRLVSTSSTATVTSSSTANTTKSLKPATTATKQQTKTNGGNNNNKKKGKKSKVNGSSKKQDKLAEALRYTEEEVAVLRQAALTWVKLQQQYLQRIKELEAENEILRAQQTASGINSQAVDLVAAEKSSSHTSGQLKDVDITTLSQQQKFDAAYEVAQQTVQKDDSKNSNTGIRTQNNRGSSSRNTQKGDVTTVPNTDRTTATMNDNDDDLNKQMREVELLQAMLHDDFKAVVPGSSDGRVQPGRPKYGSNSRRVCSVCACVCVCVCKQNQKRKRSFTTYTHELRACICMCRRITSDSGLCSNEVCVKDF